VIARKVFTNVGPISDVSLILILIEVIYFIFRTKLLYLAEMWKRLNFCGSGSTLKKEDGSGSKLGSI